ncbi:hypothetical protein [Mesorhizobium sp. M0199]|uniref:hypothetical protein n=1 Tax=unclassified Mesorhizobium TaxID=325217 RepID=UPI00333D0174
MYVGPATLRAQQLPYIHTDADKLSWRKEVGDKLDPKADPLAEKRKAFWDRIGTMPPAQEISELEALGSGPGEERSNKSFCPFR